MILEQVTAVCHFNGIDRSLKPGIYFNCIRSGAAKNKVNPDGAEAPACCSDLFCPGNHFLAERMIKRSDRTTEPKLGFSLAPVKSARLQ